MNVPSIEHEVSDALARGKKTAAYKAQEQRLVALQEGFSVALAVVWLMATRSAAFVANSLSFAFTHDAFQTMAAVTSLASNGMYAPAKRELRYLLESATKHAFVDLHQANQHLAARVQYLEKKVPRSSVDFILGERFFGLSSVDEADFEASIVSLYKRLSAFVHRSPTQLRQEMRQMGKGPPEPKLIATELERFNRECLAVYDIAVFLQFQVLGPGLSGDVFVNAFDPVQR